MISLHRRLEFQRLLSEVSTHFINLHPEEIDKHINDALGRVGCFLGFNLVAISKFAAQDHRAQVTHIWTAEGLPTIPPGLTNFDFPWCAAQLREGLPAHLANLDALPPAGQRDRQTYEQLGIQTAYSWPLRVAGATVGCLGFGSVGVEQRFPVEFEAELKLLAQVLANALVRQRADLALRESEARLHLAADAGELGLWSLNLATERFWITDKTRKLFKFPPGEEVTFERFLGLVHPEDQAAVRETVRRMLQARSDGQVEYRAVRPDGSVRWMFSRGRVHVGATGEPEALMGVTVDNTTRKQAEEALRAGEERLDLAFRAAQDGVWDWNIETDEVLYSARWKAMLGYDESEIEPHAGAWKRLLHPDDLPRAMQVVQDVLHGKREYVMEFRMRHKGGHYVDVLSRGFPVRRAPNGPIVRIVGTHFDLTERKRAELALREKEERLSAAVDVAALGFFELRGMDRHVFLDNRIRSILGIPDAQVSETWQLWAEHLHPGDREQVLEFSRQVLEGPLNSVSTEYRYLHPQRGIVWLRHVSRVFERDAQGRVLRLLGVMQDITERKLAEEKLRQASEVLERNPALIVITDTQGNISYVNRRFSEVTGYSRAEIIGKNPRLLKSGECPPAFYRELWATITQGQTWRGEFHNRKKNGELYWESAVISPLRDEAGKITRFVAIKEDITERKRAEQEIAQQRNQLTHLSRVNMLGELAGSLAHELNQPLTAVLSNAQAAQRFLAHDPPDLSEVRDILADIVAEDKRAGEVIRRLRLLLKKGEVQHQPLLPNEVVQEVLKLVRSDLVNQNFTAQTELASDLPVLHGDRVQLQQVLLNLVMNACDAMAGRARDQRQLTIRTCQTEDGFVHISVADCGAGIAPEKLEQVFDPFYTTKPHGMGLGLTVCRTIVTAHGGKLWASNNPGQGATFHIALPVSAKGPGASAGLREQESGSRRVQ